MGFLDSIFDSLGSTLGKMAADNNEILEYKSEYECMSDYDLKREYNNLKNKSREDLRKRFIAVKLVLKDRGYFQ